MNSLSYVNNPLQIKKIYSPQEISDKQKAKGKFINQRAYRIQFRELAEGRDSPATMIAIKKSVKYDANGRVKFNWLDKARFFPLLVEDQIAGKIYSVCINIRSLTKRLGYIHPLIKQELEDAIKTRNPIRIELSIKKAIDCIRQQPQAHTRGFGLKSTNQPPEWERRCSNLFRRKTHPQTVNSSDSSNDGDSPHDSLIKPLLQVSFSPNSSHLSSHASNNESRSLITPQHQTPPLPIPRQSRASRQIDRISYASEVSDSDLDSDSDSDISLTPHFNPFVKTSCYSLAAAIPDPWARKGPEEVAAYLEANRRFAAIQREEEHKPYGFHISCSTNIPETMEILVEDGYIEENNLVSFTKTVALHGKTIQISNKTIGISWCVGRRPTMEDVHLATIKEFQGGKRTFECYGVFDGHSGPDAAIFVKDNICEHLANALNRDSEGQLTNDKIVYAIESACREVNTAYKETGKEGGTTAAFVIRFPESDRIWVANVGDSRVVLIDGNKIIQGSEDAKPEIPRYRRAIEALGGHVGKPPGNVYRVNTLGLAMATAFGDFDMVGETGECCITAKPEIADYKEPKWIVIATDGIWDVGSSKQVARAIQQMDGKRSPEEMAKLIVKTAIDCSSYDNGTAIVIECHQHSEAAAIG